ncbi:MAG TPA: DNA-processing protein DprA [Terriglobales bacterium]|nr:DNA-processing protein DprA [Terriglobales bacterium]
MSAAPALEARIVLSWTAAEDPAAAWDVAGESERARAARTAAILRSLGARALARGDRDYPAALLDLRDAPRVVFVRGALPERERAVAIVGSRAASPYGIAQAVALASGLARLGYAIVSGLARGIDAAAHRGALEAGGASVAVLPGGLDDVTPRHHAALADSLCARGGLLTERASGPPPHPSTFLDRNRLIAALAAATVVVEAAARSGALATAAAARRLGRPVLAVPGDVDRETSRGAHALIREGAAICEQVGDVLCVLPRSERPAPSAAAAFRLRAALGTTSRTVEELARVAELPVDETLALLLELEWAGAARALPGQRWRMSRP